MSLLSSLFGGSTKQYRKKITRDVPIKEFNEMLVKHVKWLYNEEGGEQLDLSYCDVRGVNLSGVDLRKAKLHYANFSGVNFSNANLEGADLSFAVMDKALLSNVNARYTEFYATSMKNAILQDSDFTFAIMEKIDLDGVRVCRCTGSCLIREITTSCPKEVQVEDLRDDINVPRYEVSDDIDEVPGLYLADGSMYCEFDERTEDIWAFRASLSEQEFRRIYREKIAKVVFPRHFTEIPDGCCMYMDALESVVMFDNVVKIQNVAFRDSRNLKHVRLSKNLTTIGTMAFYTTGLESVEIPDSVQYMGSAVFDLCTKLRSIRLSKNLKVLPIDALRSCISLENITGCEGVKYIRKCAFEQTDKISDISDFKNVCVLDECALLMNRLYEYAVPKTVHTLGSLALDRGRYLTTVKIYHKIENVSPECIEDPGVLARLVVRTLPELVEYYKEAFGGKVRVKEIGSNAEESVYASASAILGI